MPGLVLSGLVWGAGSATNGTKRRMCSLLHCHARQQSATDAVGFSVATARRGSPSQDNHQFNFAQLGCVGQAGRRPFSIRSSKR
jgi:hypothetical protein